MLTKNAMPDPRTWREVLPRPCVWSYDTDLPGQMHETILMECAERYSLTHPAYDA